MTVKIPFKLQVYIVIIYELLIYKFSGIMLIVCVLFKTRYIKISCASSTLTLTRSWKNSTDLSFFKANFRHLLLHS